MPTPPSATPDPTLSPDNLQDTHESIYWDHPLPFQKHPDSLQILLQNTSGLDARTDYRKLNYLAHSMAAYQVDIGCLAETNVDWKKPTANYECNTILRKHFKHHRLVTSTSQADAAHSYLPGGTATLAVNEWTGRISETGADLSGLGHWSFIRTKGKSEKKLLVVTA
jgi:hypothetical protein